MVGVRNDVDDLNQLLEGQYGLYNGLWYARPPNFNYVAALVHHDVAENTDSTLTVNPSILIKVPGVGIWHGYLINGIWSVIE